MSDLIGNAELTAELKAIAAESIGWQPLDRGAYLHTGNPDETDTVITIVGGPDLEMAAMNVLLLVG